MSDEMRAPHFSRLLFTLASGAALLACPRRDVPTPGNVGLDAEATLPADGSASVADATPPADGRLPWTEAIRHGRWKEAEDAILALAGDEQNKPDIRFARARVALALGRHPEALTQLEKLEDDLPLLRDAILKARAEASIVAGPYDRAALWYAAGKDASSWIVAADAWDKAGDPARARAECDRVIGAAKRSASIEEKARRLRMKILRAKDDHASAAADARWLATHALDEATASEASTLLEKLPTPAPLTAAELATRSHVLAHAGRSSEAIRTLDRAATAAGAGGKGSRKIDLCHARAEAYYKDRAHYPEAALSYRSCAAMGGPSAAEDSFLAARALSRAHRDTEALAAFASVAREHPKTTWAAQASFHIGRDHALAGRWKEAARILDDYAKRFPGGRDKREAERYRAIAHLNARDRKTARKLLEGLAGASADADQQARWANLAALAALWDDDRTHAVARWSDVARAHPLSWAALVARARLASIGAPLPPAIDTSDSPKAREQLAVMLPPPVDTLHRVGLDADAADALREREAGVVATAHGRGTEALCAAYGLLDRGKRRFQVALQIPGSLLASAPGAHNRWAWECAYPRPYEVSIHASEARSSLPPGLLWSVMRQESAFDEEAVSPARAVGLLQLMPDTAKVVARTAGMPHEETWLTRPDHNISLGAFYLRDLLDKLHGNVPLAAGAYNAGPEAIARWQTHSGGAPLDVFVETIPFLETRDYVTRVMSNLARYAFLHRGETGVPTLTLDPW